MLDDARTREATGLSCLSKSGIEAIGVLERSAVLLLSATTADSRLVGGAALMRPTVGGTTQLAYWIATPHRGKGLARPLLLALIAHAQVHGVASLEAVVRRSNDRSVAALRSAGFLQASCSIDDCHLFCLPIERTPEDVHPLQQLQ